MEHSTSGNALSQFASRQAGVAAVFSTGAAFGTSFVAPRAPVAQEARRATLAFWEGR